MSSVFRDDLASCDLIGRSPVDVARVSKVRGCVVVSCADYSAAATPLKVANQLSSLTSSSFIVAGLLLLVALSSVVSIASVCGGVCGGRSVTVCLVIPASRRFLWMTAVFEGGSVSVSLGSCGGGAFFRQHLCPCICLVPVKSIEMRVYVAQLL